MAGEQEFYNLARRGGAKSWGTSGWESSYQASKAAGFGGSTDQFGGWADSQGHYHGPTDGTISPGESWVWQSGTMGRQSDGTYADGMWVGNPDAPAGMCGKGPKPAVPVNEEAIWGEILEDWVESHPNDPVAQWIYTKSQPVSMQGKKRTEWMAERKAQQAPFTAPSWIGEAGLGITAPPAEGIEEVSGETVGLRPMGGQLSLSSDQMEQLMYYYGWLETGQPSTPKSWLQSAAYRMPNKWADYLAESAAAMPTKAPPKAQTKPAWQR